MTTAITTICNALAAKMASIYTTAVRLPNAYDVKANNDLYLANGYGIAVGAATLPGELQEVGCHQDIVRRTFRLVLTRQLTSTEHDTSTRYAVEEAILEDARLLRRAIDQDVTLAGNLDTLDYIGDDGVEFLASDALQFLKFSMTIVVVYHDDLT